MKKKESVALKGIAILCMIFHHCFRVKEKYQGYQMIFAPFAEEQILKLGGYMKICVPIFAFLSGYGLMYSYRNRAKEQSTRKWIKKHWISTGEDFWFIAVFAYLIHILLGQLEMSEWGETKSERAFEILADSVGVSGILGTKSLNGTWWYMGTALLFIAILPVLYNGMRRYGATAVLVIAMLVPRVFEIGFPGGNKPLSFLAVFILGMICQGYQWFERWHEWKWIQSDRYNMWLKAIVLVMINVINYKCYKQISISIFWEYQYMIVPFCVILFCKEYLLGMRPLVGLLCWIGSHSLNIWLIHTFIRDGLPDIVWGTKYFMLAPGILFIIALLGSILIEQVKRWIHYHKWIQRISG